MQASYSHLLAVLGTAALLASVGYQQAQLPSQVDTALLGLVNGVNSIQLPDGLSLEASQQQHKQSLFSTSGQLTLTLSASPYQLQYALQYEVQHGIDALFSGADLSAKLFNVGNTDHDSKTSSSLIVHRQPALFRGTFKPGRLEITGTIPALKGNSSSLLISSQPATLSFTASQPGSQQQWGQTHLRLKLPKIQLWEDYSRAEGITLTELCIDAHQQKADSTLSAAVETRLDKLELKSRTELVQLSDLQLSNNIRLQESLNILWSLHFNRFSSRYIDLHDGHMQLSLNGIDGNAVRQLIEISQQASQHNWSTARIRSTYAQQLEAAATQLLTRNPQLTLQVLHASVPASNNTPEGNINFNANIQLDHTRLPDNFISQLTDNSLALPQLASAVLATLTVNSHGPATELARNLIRPVGEPFEQAIADGHLNFQLENGIAILDNHPLR